MVLPDFTVLLETAAPGAAEARERLARFAELVKAPEHVQTFRLTPLSLWNAAASGATPAEVLGALGAFARYGVPPNVATEVRALMERFGRLELVRPADGSDQELEIVASDPAILREIASAKAFLPYVVGRGPRSVRIRAGARGHAKKALLDLGYPVRDLAGFEEGERLEVRLRAVTTTGAPLALRRYQEAAVVAFHQGGAASGGHGVVALPCGAGKTLVGLAAMAAVGASTLVVCTSTLAARQWIREILDKTTIAPADVGEYTGDAKEIRPITVATYQVLTWRRRRGAAAAAAGARADASPADFPHMEVFRARPWGLVIYDEVHLLPAPVFRVTAEIQAKRRLGLTATLVREDGLEGDVFSLIGPKRYDAPWRELERAGWIAEATCSEIRVPFDAARREEYAVAPDRLKYGLAATNPAKLPALEAIVRSHAQDRVLVIGTYVDQLHKVAARLGAPLVTGETREREREKLFARFRDGDLRLLVVSKVANFSIDLPEANVAIQISGSFGSRQEEAQRLGRILRPKRDGGAARFYSIVTRESADEDVNAKRQLFLVEQGYRYEIANWETVAPMLERLQVVTP